MSRRLFYASGLRLGPRIEKQILTLFAAFSYLVEAANQNHQGDREDLLTRCYTPLIELLIGDCANRLFFIRKTLAV